MAQETPTNKDSSRPPRPLCRFFVVSASGIGTCRYGENCSFSHELPEGGIEEARKLIPCPFFARGTCKYGKFCQLRHDTVDNIPASGKGKQDDGLTCGICLEVVSRPGRCNSRFGLLSFCDHIFCFECLMEWRKEGSKEVVGRRSCPTCRKHSHYVVPSSVFAMGKEKEELVTNYKAKLAIIPCKKFNGRLGSCPFGKDCFYMHMDEDGEDIKLQDKSMKELYDEQSSRRRRRQSYNHRYSGDINLLNSFLLMLDLYASDMFDEDAYDSGDS
mmetsp:Transcript_1471/g.2169  ORF Transcript_1471/g.2169 Transcript_1471/m.2169 type:complete len:272 (-) Transcript_1471:65-880(-)